MNKQIKQNYTPCKFALVEGGLLKIKPEAQIESIELQHSCYPMVSVTLTCRNMNGKDAVAKQTDEEKMARLRERAEYFVKQQAEERNATGKSDWLLASLDIVSMRCALLGSTFYRDYKIAERLQALHDDYVAFEKAEGGK